MRGCLRAPAQTNGPVYVPSRMREHAVRGIAVMEQDLEALGPFLSRVDHLLIELPVVFRPRKAIQGAFSSPLTKSAKSESIVCRDQTGVRLWRWVGRKIVKAT